MSTHSAERSPSPPDKKLWQRDVTTFERDFLYEGLRGPAYAARLAALRAHAAQGGFDTHALRIFDAVEHHEATEQLRGGFLDALRRRADGDPLLITLTPTDIADTFVAYDASHEPGKEPTTREDRAIAGYDDARRATEWPMERMKSSDAVTLQSDLAYLRALRIRDTGERNRALDRIEADLAARAMTEQHFGISAEHQVTWLIRRWARDADAAHRIVVTHALPKDDYARGTDLTLEIGIHQFAINLKTLNLNDSNTAEHQRAILAKGEAKASAANACLVAMPTDTLRAAWRLTTQSKRDDTEQRHLRKLQREFFAAFDAAGAPLTECFRPPQQPKRERAPRALTDTQLKKLLSAAILRTFDCITADVLAHPKIYMDVQQRFLQAAKGRIMRAEDLTNPSDDLKKEIRQAMES